MKRKCRLVPAKLDRGEYVLHTRENIPFYRHEL